MRANQFISNDSDAMRKPTSESVAGPEKCWPGYRKVGTQPGTGKNAGKRVNDCEKIKEDDVAEGILNKIANKVMGAAPEQPKYKVGQRVKYETSPQQPDWEDGGSGVGVITSYKNGHYMINGNPVNHFEIKGVVEQGVAEGWVDTIKNIFKRKPKDNRTVFDRDPEAMREFERSGGYEAGLDIMGWQIGWFAAEHAQGDTMQQAFSKLYYGGGSPMPFDNRSFKLAWVAYNKHHGPQIAEQGVAEGNYDRDDYYNARQGREYGKDLTATGYGGDGSKTRRDDIFKGQSKRLPADPFARTSGAVPKSGTGRIHSNALPGEMDEANDQKIGGRYDADDFDDMVSRLKKLAGAGPMKTVYDPNRRVYRNMPTAQQPAQQPKK